MNVLYHGGSAAVLERVKREGLVPRVIHKGKDNWKHTVTSNKNSVYLTTAYPWHFAACASDKGQKGVIYEINRDLLLPWLLCPDEDFMEQASRACPPDDEHPHMAPTDWSIKKRTMHYRKIARYNAALADVSLEHLGTVGYYGKIPWKAIKRYVLIDWTKLHPATHMQAVDSMVSCLNYRILQDRHKAFVRWFFNDPVTAAEVCGSALWLSEGIDEKLRKHEEERTEAWSIILAERAGLELVETGH